jgi:hypothetical protein
MAAVVALAAIPAARAQKHGTPPAFQPLGPNPEPYQPPQPYAQSVGFTNVAAGLPDNAPLLFQVAQVVVTMSDGGPFQGSLGFGPPYYDGTWSTTGGQGQPFTAPPPSFAGPAHCYALDGSWIVLNCALPPNVVGMWLWTNVAATDPASEDPSAPATLSVDP